MTKGNKQSRSTKPHKNAKKITAKDIRFFWQGKEVKMGPSMKQALSTLVIELCIKDDEKFND